MSVTDALISPVVLTCLVVTAIGGCARAIDPAPGDAGAPASGAATGGTPAGGSAGGEGGSSNGLAGAAATTSCEEPAFDAGACRHPPVEPRCSDGWCEIPAGCFVMGSPECEWGHAPIAEARVAVTLTSSFLIQQTEATRGDWLSQGLPDPAVGAADAGSCIDDPTCPIGNVTWFEAAAYANLLSERHDPPLEPCYRLISCQGELGTGLRCSSAEPTAPTVYDCEGFRLPTEAEWEYAARAGTTTAYYSGQLTAYGDFLKNVGVCNPDPNLERIGWYCYNSGGVAHPIKQLEPNAWGLYDITGNLNEWASDRFDGASPSTPVNPGGTLEGAREWRNIRGCAFYSWASLCRVANTNERAWWERDPSYGFRLVRTLKR